ncbi:MAG TPA: L,D-transpeptidase, partial [Mycobacterium sp.]|nr:L,D-transpeptidase [Mycobacterium sp.]
MRRQVVLCVLAAIGVNSVVAAGPAGASMVATNQADKRSAATNPLLKPAIASIQPTRGEVVGVAHPVAVTFNAPVADKHAAERAIDIKSTPAMTGKFEWLGSNLVQWVPDRFWPAHSTIALSVGGLSTAFQTGPAVVGVASISDHTFTVSIDGVEAGPPSALPAPHHRPHWGEPGVFPASMGSADYPTPVGTYTVLAKERSVVMDSSSVG